MRVPEDVALTGFDDDEDRMLYPFFSTVHVDTKWLGRRMVHEFLWREEHPGPERTDSRFGGGCGAPFLVQAPGIEKK